MIGSVRGTLVDREANGGVLVEVAGTGLGYRVTMGPAESIAIGAIGDEVSIWVHHHIREDTQCLYGFAGRAERDTFEALLGAHGVGPALALAILSVHQPEALARVVGDEDIAALCLVPGVGKKTAARLLIELKSRIVPSSGGGAAGGGTSATGMLADVQAALEGLGFRPEEINDVLALADVRDASDASGAVRVALRHLGNAR